MHTPPVLSAVDGKIITVQFSVLHLTFSTMEPLTNWPLTGLSTAAAAFAAKAPIHRISRTNCLPARLIAPGAQPSRVASQPFECVIAAEPLRAGLPNDSGCEHGNALNATSHHQGAIHGHDAKFKAAFRQPSVDRAAMDRWRLTFLLV